MHGLIDRDYTEGEARTTKARSISVLGLFRDLGAKRKLGWTRLPIRTANQSNFGVNEVPISQFVLK